MDAIKERVEKALEKIRPYLVADGGDISIVEITALDIGASPVIVGSWGLIKLIFPTKAGVLGYVPY